MNINELKRRPEHRLFCALRDRLDELLASKPLTTDSIQRALILVLGHVTCIAMEDAGWCRIEESVDGLASAVAAAVTKEMERWRPKEIRPSLN